MATSHAQTVTPLFPLKASANNRYLVDQNNVPFMVVGDSPQSMIGNLSLAQAEFFMADRQARAVNALWINLLCNFGTRCNDNGTTRDGVPPFTAAEDLATPNPAYFQRAEDMLNLAASHNMVVFLDPIEVIGWLGILRANGTAKAFAFGQYLGNRFKHVPNIVWMSGNDFQTWRDPADDALVRAVAQGIKSTDPNHLHTVSLDYYVSASLDNTTWRNIIDLDAVYTYLPTYAKIMTEYRRVKFKPIFMVEANYEFEHNNGTDGGSTRNLRLQEYWTMLSGATGQFYGSLYTWQFAFNWQTNLNTPGIQQLSYMAQLFANRRWYDLVPDRPPQVFVGGRGFFVKTGSIETNDYATAAYTLDGSLAIAYMPTIRRLRVDLSKMAGPVTARWFDPANGQYTAISGSPFPNSGIRGFLPPGPNADGDGDWVLVLESN